MSCRFGDSSDILSSNSSSTISSGKENCNTNNEFMESIDFTNDSSMYDDGGPHTPPDTPRHRLSFSGFPSLDSIVSIQSVDDQTDGRRRSMVVHILGKHIQEELDDDDDADDGNEEDENVVEEVCSPPHPKNMLVTPKVGNIDYEVQIEDRELVQFCGVVLQLLRREMKPSPGQPERYHRETLPKLREAFNNLVKCTHVPAWLSHKAKELKKDLEKQLHETICEKQQQHQPIHESDAEPSRSGMISFVRQCVRAIAILKEKIEDDKVILENVEQQKRQAAEAAKEEAQKEADDVWSRRLSLIRKDAENKTRRKLEEEFNKNIQVAVERAKTEVEEKMEVRIQQEQRDRRLSAQLKISAAVERASRRAEMEKGRALSRLAEELEKEKEEVARNAAQIARTETEEEWRRRMSIGVRRAREEALHQVCEDEKEGSTVSSENSQVAVQNTQQFHVKSEEPVWFEGNSKMGKNSFDNQKRVSFILHQHGQDYSKDYALPSPIPIISMPIGGTPMSAITSHHLNNITDASRVDETINTADRPFSPPNGEVVVQSTTPLSTTASTEQVNIEDDPTPRSPGSISNENYHLPTNHMPFEIVDLSVKVGKIQGFLSSKYREYHINAVAATNCKQIRTRKSVRYSAARSAYLDRFQAACTQLGLQYSYESVFSSFPPKVMSGSNTLSVGKLRAKALQNYLLTVYDVSSQVMRIARSEQEREDVRTLLYVVFKEFLP